MRLGRDLRETKPFKVDENGTQYFRDWTCKRCGGVGGADQWTYTGYTCYDCGGTGRASEPSIYKVYTPEYAAKLEERRKAREAKRNAERTAQADKMNADFLNKEGLDAQGRTFVYTGDTYGIKDELKAGGAKYNGFIGWHSPQQIGTHKAVQVEADLLKDDFGVIVGYNPAGMIAKVKAALLEEKKANSTSQYVGAAGDKITFAGTFDHSTCFDIKSFRGYGTETMFIHTFKDDNGNAIIWKTGRGLNFAEGDHIEVTGTVKEHSEYDGVRQTVLTRCKVTRK